MIIKKHNSSTGVPPVQVGKVCSSTGVSPVHGVPPVQVGKVCSSTDVPPVQGFKNTRRNLPHWQLSGSVYFITWRCKEGLTLNPDEKNIVLRAIVHWDNIKWTVYCAVVMPDHVHVLAQPLEKAYECSFDLAEIIYSIKSFSAHKINKIRDIKGAFWQDERFDRVIRDEKELEEKWEYIRTNPVKNNLAERPEEYKWFYQRG